MRFYWHLALCNLIPSNIAPWLSLRLRGVKREERHIECVCQQKLIPMLDKAIFKFSFFTCFYFFATWGCDMNFVLTIKHSTAKLLKKVHFKRVKDIKVDFVGHHNHLAWIPFNSILQLLQVSRNQNSYCPLTIIFSLNIKN